ncbi:CRAL-TRIO domain-containing protein [Limtongia smithiae]|uniref:CRAL-TRIO domain-containing protein n=1 Tax=Limtongia smithiae TaxID=1125753 RepID=UPI0034CE974C
MSRFRAFFKPSSSLRIGLRAAPVLLFVSANSNIPSADLHPPPFVRLYRDVLAYPPSPYFIALYPPFDMPADPAPGRPGNLTPEQEAKLKELWVLTMRTFGVAVPPTLQDAAAAAAPALTAVKSANGSINRTDSVATAATDEKKKKRFGVFRKKDKEDKKEKALKPTTSTLSSPTIGLEEDDNDKYGQSKQFKTALAEMSPDELRVAFWSMVKADHPDGLLLRFLRARKWDVKRALVMMVSTMHWRLKEMDVESIVFRGEGAALAEHDEDFMKQIRLGKSYLHGTDKTGRPICTVRARLHRQGDQSEDALNRYTIYVMETARMCLKDPVDTATVLFDLSDFSLANMDYAPVKFMIKCFEAHYPESLGVCIVYKAPWIFQGVWKIVRGWLDPVVATKINFASNIDDLSKFIHREHVWKELGGPVDWEYKFIEPIPGEDALLKDEATREKLLENRAKIVREFEDATWQWIYSSATEPRQARHDIAKRLRTDYIALDPYMRARTVYDRTDYINLVA